MKEKPDQETTVSYVRIVEHRDKAVCVDLGEGDPFWFPRSRICLDEDNFSFTAPQSLIDKKRCPMTSGETAADAFSQQYIKLATPVWRSDKAIGIDVTVSNPANRRGGSIKKRVFFPLNLYKNGAVPRWLMLKKERQLLEEMAEGSRYSPDNFVVRGLTANRKAA